MTFISFHVHSSTLEKITCQSVITVAPGLLSALLIFSHFIDL